MECFLQNEYKPSQRRLYSAVLGKHTQQMTHCDSLLLTRAWLSWLPTILTMFLFSTDGRCLRLVVTQLMKQPMSVIGLIVTVRVLI